MNIDTAGEVVTMVIVLFTAVVFITWIVILTAMVVRMKRRLDTVRIEAIAEVLEKLRYECSRLEWENEKLKDARNKAVTRDLGRELSGKDPVKRLA